MNRIVLAGVVMVGACGGPDKQPMPSTWANFECKDRSVSYMVVGGMAAQEAGVTVACAAPEGPHVMRYTVEKDGTRTEDSAAITPGEFNDLWVAIEGTGWRHLDDCAPDPGTDVPVYQFDVKDENGSMTIGCDSLRPEFPYNTFVDELDQKAATIRGDRGKNTMDIDDSDIDLKN